jgi:hypothetical protein
MTEKKGIKTTNHTPPNLERQNNLDNRWAEERRKQTSQGYTYISSVGWIDRREKLRRKDDPDDF